MLGRVLAIAHVFTSLPADLRARVHSAYASHERWEFGGHLGAPM